MTYEPSPDGDEELQEAVAAWHAKFADQLGPGEAGSHTLSGIEVKPLYTPLDVPSETGDYLARLGLPGEAPYTRGMSPGMYRERLWVMGQYSGVASATETNK